MIRDIHKKIYGHTEAVLDQYLPKHEFSDGDWDSTSGKILDDIQRYFFEEVEHAYLQSLEAIEDLYRDGKIDEAFRDTFIEYINNRNMKYWDFTQSY